MGFSKTLTHVKSLHKFILDRFSACPSAIVVEVSRDGLSNVPLGGPQLTSGYTSIKLKLQKPEVVTSVTIRFHRPFDSSSLGLSQIRLLGDTAFSETQSARTEVEDEQDPR